MDWVTIRDGQRKGEVKSGMLKTGRGGQGGSGGQVGMEGEAWRWEVTRWTEHGGGGAPNPPPEGRRGPPTFPPRLEDEAHRHETLEGCGFFCRHAPLLGSENYCSRAKEGRGGGWECVGRGKRR